MRAVICTVLYGVCCKTTHSCILVVEREKGKVKEVCFAYGLGCGKTCRSFCENFWTVLQENSVSCTAERRLYVNRVVLWQCVIAADNVIFCRQLWERS